MCVCERIHNFYLKSDLKAPVVPHYCQNGKGSEGKKAGNRYGGGGLGRVMGWKANQEGAFPV